MNGIPMTPDNQKAIRAQLKTQTRRLDHLKEINQSPNDWQVKQHGTDYKGNMVWAFDIPDTTTCRLLIKPRYRIGETVYIKEAWRPYSENEVQIEYRLDGAIIDYPNKPRGYCYGCGQRWRSPMFLPEWAARTFITITDVRPERLRDITLADIYDEGVDVVPAYDRIDAFKRLWDSINGKTHPYDLNPWVWRICFNLIEGKR